MWLAGSTVTAVGLPPTGTVGGFWLQPDLTWPLQVAPSMTETVLPDKLVT